MESVEPRKDKERNWRVVTSWTEKWASELVAYFYFSCCGLDMEGFEQGVLPLAIWGLIKFLFAPVSRRNCSLTPSLAPYSMYGTLERHRS